MAAIQIQVDPVTGMPIFQKDWIEVYRNPSVWNESTGQMEEGQQRIKFRDDVLAALKEAGFGDMVGGNATFDPQFWSSTGDPYSYEDPILGSVLKKTGEREGTRFAYQVNDDGTISPTGETSVEEMYTNPGAFNQKALTALGGLLAGGMAGNYLMGVNGFGGAGAGGLLGATEPVSSLALGSGSGATGLGGATGAAIGAAEPVASLEMFPGVYDAAILGAEGSLPSALPSYGLSGSVPFADKVANIGLGKAVLDTAGNAIGLSNLVSTVPSALRFLGPLAGAALTAYEAKKNNGFNPNTEFINKLNRPTNWQQPQFTTGLMGPPQFTKTAFYQPQFQQQTPLGLLG